MFLNYLKIALRSLLRHRTFSFINLFGLSIGLAASMLLLTFIHHELSYEKMHENRERIYRTIAKVNVSEDKTMIVSAAPGEVPVWLKNELPGVQHVVRIDPLRVRAVAYKNREIRDFTGHIVDSAFVEMFSLEATRGNLQKALNGPGKMVITEGFARRLFGGANPLGKTVIAGEEEYAISAVLKELPPNTFLDFDCLVSVASLRNEQQYFENRGISVATFIQFHKGANLPGLRNKTVELIEDRTREKMEDFGIQVDFSLQALDDMHLHSSHLSYDLADSGSMLYIYIFSALAFLILLIAIINYVNLETARAEKRGREVGMRKVNGASRSMLIMQFLGEAVLLSLVAFLLAYLMVELAMPSFENLLNRQFENTLHQPLQIGMFFGLALITGVLAGLYPAFYLSAYNPTRIFRTFRSTGSNALRALLVVAQFTIAAFLIMSLLVIFHQIQYMKGKSLGFDREQVLVIDNIPAAAENSLESIRNELEQYPQVEAAAFSMSYPGQISTHNEISLSIDEKGVLSKTNHVDAAYRKVMGIEMAKGRYFMPGRATDSAAYVINERAVEVLGLEKPLGKTLYYNKEDPGPVIGVMKNYHMEPLRNQITPVVHQLIYDYNNIVVRFEPAAAGKVVQLARNVLREYDENYRMDYDFLDQYFAGMYRQEERMNKLGMIGSGLAIVIALLGLFAMASYIVISQRRAIGIRKAMGATRATVLRMLMVRIHKWVLLSIILAAPAAYYVMEQWLANFAYRISVSAWHLVVGALLVLLISMLTILYQTVSASRINPADTLRDE